VRGTERAQQGAQGATSGFGSTNSFARWGERSSGRNRRRKVKDCDRGALGAGASFQLGGGLLHLLAQGVQIVGGGYNGKQQDQNAAQRPQAQQRSVAPFAARPRLPAPRHQGWHHQKQPAEIEENFHREPDDPNLRPPNSTNPLQSCPQQVILMKVQQKGHRELCKRIHRGISLLHPRAAVATRPQRQEIKKRVEIPEAQLLRALSPADCPMKNCFWPLVLSQSLSKRGSSSAWLSSSAKLSSETTMTPRAGVRANSARSMEIGTLAVLLDLGSKPIRLLS